MSSMSNRLGIKGYRCVRRVETQQLDLHVRPTGRPRACRHCGHKRLRSKGRYQRRVRHLESLGRESRLLVDCQRFVCQSVICGRSFVEPLPGILPGRHSSEPFREQIYVLHHEGIPGSVMARLRKLGGAYPKFCVWVDFVVVFQPVNLLTGKIDFQTEWQTGRSRLSSSRGLFAIS